MSGRKLADSWVLEESELRRRPAVSRPLSARMAWGLIDQLSGRQYGFIDDLSAHERYRVRQLVDRLRAADDPVLLVRSWLTRRAQRVELSCAPRDLDDLARDGRVVRSGISDERSGMSAASESEGYVLSAERASLAADHLLVPSPQPNVFFHVDDRRILEPVPLIVLAADLAEHNGAREDGQAEKLLAALWS